MTKPKQAFWLLAAILPLTAIAQTPVSDQATADFTRQAGDRELMIGGSGGANTDFDDSFGGVTVAYGTYFNSTVVGVVRQTINYSNPNNGGRAWNGATKLAVDKHILARGAVRPFVGVNFGGIYGDSVNDSWGAGLETGLKFYVQPRTFIVATVEYSWLFDRADSVDDRFSDGQWNWSLGVGFNF